MMTSCCVARSSDDIGAAGSTSSPKFRSAASRSSMALRHVDHAEAPRLAVEADVLRDAEIGNDIHLLRNQRDAGRSRLPACSPAGRLGRQARSRRYSCPAACAPARIWISVDLPAPFAPSSAMISPGAIDRLTSSSARTPGKSLVSRLTRRIGALGRPAGAERRPMLQFGSKRVSPTERSAPRSSRSSASCPARSCRPRRCSASTGACRRSPPSRPG